MHFYKKRPIVIQAMQYHGALSDYLNSAARVFGDDFISKTIVNGDDLFIRTLEGDHRVAYGDFVIKGVKGEFYPCRPDIFKLTYDEVVTE